MIKRYQYHFKYLPKLRQPLFIYPGAKIKKVKGFKHKKWKFLRRFRFSFKKKFCISLQDVSLLYLKKKNKKPFLRYRRIRKIKPTNQKHFRLRKMYRNLTLFKRRFRKYYGNRLKLFQFQTIARKSLKEASRNNVSRGFSFLMSFEWKIDVILFRLFLVSSLLRSRLLIKKNHVKVNGSSISYIHCRLKPQDLIEINPLKMVELQFLYVNKYYPFFFIRKFSRNSHVLITVKVLINDMFYIKPRLKELKNRYLLLLKRKVRLSLAFRHKIFNRKLLVLRQISWSILSKNFLTAYSVFINFHRYLRVSHKEEFLRKTRVFLSFRSTILDHKDQMKLYRIKKKFLDAFLRDTFAFSRKLYFKRRLLRCLPFFSPHVSFRDDIQILRVLRKKNNFSALSESLMISPLNFDMKNMRFKSKKAKNVRVPVLRVVLKKKKKKRFVKMIKRFISLKLKKMSRLLGKISQLNKNLI